MASNKLVLTKQDKLKQLNMDENINISDEYIDILYNARIINNKTKNNPIKLKEIKAIDKTTDKYKILLKLLNAILINMNKPIITDIKDFKDIDRDDINKDINKHAFANMEDEIYKYYNKSASGWYQRKSIKYFVVSFLKYASGDIGANFNSKRKDINMTINNKRMRTTHMFYTIE